MRLVLKNALILLAFYFLGVLGLIAWTHMAIQQSSTALMEETAHLVGREMASALTEDLIDELAGRRGGIHASTLESLAEMQRQSALLEAITVVDNRGRDAASLPPVTGTPSYLTPRELFGDDRRPRLTTREPSLGRGQYLLEMPLLLRGELVGYLRLLLRSSQIDDLYKNLGYLLVLRDGKLLDALETDLGQAAQLRSLTHLYMGVTHDLKAPLNAMGLHLALLKQSLQDGSSTASGEPSDRVQWLGIVEQELARTLKALLAQTAPQSRRADVFFLHDLTAEIEALLGPQSRQQKVELAVRRSPTPLSIKGHRDQIKQAILSVAINALEAMPEGGRLTLEEQLEDNRAVLRLSDTGGGIPPEIRRRIFSMHFTTKETGTGIGLHVARVILKAHDGTVELESSGSSGTTFRFTLPLSSAV